MKKLIAFALILCLCFTMLCACKNEDGQNNAAEDPTNEAAEGTTFDASTTENYYQDLTAPEVVEGQVTYKVYQAWWTEEEELVIQMYIINGMGAPIYDLFIEDYAVYTEEGQIAQFNMGPLDIDPVPAGEYVLTTFYFGYGVDLPNAELATLSVDCIIDFIYD